MVFLQNILLEQFHTVATLFLDLTRKSLLKAKAKGSEFVFPKKKINSRFSSFIQLSPAPPNPTPDSVIFFQLY